MPNVHILDSFIMPIAKDFTGTPTLYVGGMKYQHEGQVRTIIPVYGSSHTEVLERMTRIWQIRHLPFEELTAAMPRTLRVTHDTQEYPIAINDNLDRSAIPLDWQH